MTRLALALMGLMAFAPVEAAEFTKPDCSSYTARPEGESICFLNARLAARFENAAAIQKAGLEFIYLARPDADDPKYKDARKAAADKVQGEFRIIFSVNAEGLVHDVKIVQSSSERIGLLAQLWADTISQWTFVKPAKPVTGVSFRRIYLYSKEDDERKRKNAG